MNWFKDGDGNAIFFFSFYSEKKERHNATKIYKIYRLMEDELILEEPKQIEDYICLSIKTFTLKMCTFLYLWTTKIL